MSFHTQVRIIVYSFAALAVATLLPMISPLQPMLLSQIEKLPEPVQPILRPQSPQPAMPVTITSPFIYTFNATSTLYEAGSMDQSTSPYWWVNSGAKMVIANGIGGTIQGALPLTDTWRLLYAAANPLDTEYGKYPQNIFRLVSKHTWDNVRLSAAFRIAKDNLTNSPNRNASNGVLFMSRYQSSDTLYYAGVRVDGTAVIKKKYHGRYYTMGQKAIMPGTYNENSNPNLLPHDEWLGIRSETVTLSNGSVRVRVYWQRAGGAWTLLLEAIDDGKKYGGTPPIKGSTYAGIRTDFMDVQFKGYRAETITP